MPTPPTTIAARDLKRGNVVRWGAEPAIVRDVRDSRTWLDRLLGEPKRLRITMGRAFRANEVAPTVHPDSRLIAEVVE